MKLKKENLNKAMELMAAQALLLAPAAFEDGPSKFAPWKKGEPMPALDLINTVLPPKDACFPQTEKMYAFHASGGEASVEEAVEEGDQILFGVRPCDAASIDRMDKVFLTKGYVDAFYKRKRDGLTMVAVGCAKAAPACFCSSMGLDPGKSPNADVFLAPCEDGWAVKAQTEKGEKLLELIKPALTQEEGALLPKAQCSLKTDMGGVPEKMMKMFDHPMWDRVYRPCLGCGTCTYTCPTCYCFDINAEKAGSEGAQFRCWDSCMFSEYTRMAGGHNPRPSKKERVRNRYMHKLSYFHDRYGDHLCVGCGRCLEKCPVGMDITKVIDMVREANVE